MKHSQLGRTSLHVSPLCLGTMQFGWTAEQATAYDILAAAREHGCNFLDTANIYSRWVDGHVGGESETVIGRWLKETAVPRDSMVIASKVRGRMGEGADDEGLSRAHIHREVENSLRRLQTDYLDLYLVHWPDEETPLEETLGALDDLVQAGKVRYLGCSNFPAWLLMKALWVSDVAQLARFDVLQPHYNLVHRDEFERELRPLCADQQIAVTPYSPLAKGFLTGKYRPDTPLPTSSRAQRVQASYMNETGFAVLDGVAAVAAEHDATMAQVAIAWLLAQPTVASVIIGANSVSQLTETLYAAALPPLAADLLR